METLTTHQRRIIEEFCKEHDVSISKTYSGRGMFNRICFGLNVNDGRSPTTLVAQLIESCADECGRMYEDLGVVLMHVRDFIGLFSDNELKQDSLGKGMIYYFPTLQWGDDSEKESVDELGDEEVQSVLRHTKDAYSFDRFGEDEWCKAINLLWFKYQDRFVIKEVLRSKWTRRCEDPTADALMVFIKDPKNGCRIEDLIQ